MPALFTNSVCQSFSVMPLLRQPAPGAEMQPVDFARQLDHLMFLAFGIFWLSMFDRISQKPRKMPSFSSMPNTPPSQPCSVTLHSWSITVHIYSIAWVFSKSCHGCYKVSSEPNTLNRLVRGQYHGWCQAISKCSVLLGYRLGTPFKPYSSLLGQGFNDGPT